MLIPSLPLPNDQSTTWDKLFKQIKVERKTGKCEVENLTKYLMDRKVALTVILLPILLLFAVSGVHIVKANSSSKTIIVPDNYPTITAAIGNASNGDTIVVKNGMYIEQTLEINKSLTIISQHINGAKINFHPPQIPENLFGETIMVYTNPITIEADNVKLSGFTITSDGGDISANGNQIQLRNNTIGTEATPIGLLLTGNGTQIIGNTMATFSPLSLTGSNQTVADNYLGGLSITGSFNFITGNNAGSIMLTGSKNTVTGNSFNVNRFNGGTGINLIDADYNIISNNTEIGNNVGIALGYTGAGGSYNIFAGNTVEEAGLWGILMGNGSYNVFYGNLIANNGGLGHDGYGLALGGEDIEAANNLFFGNIFLNNSKNFGTNWQVIGSNSFDNGKEGNYWDDYLTKYPNATEVDNSGIGNTPYLVYSNNADNYPLMNRPDVSDAIPALPSPWSSLVPTTSVANISPTVSQTPSTTPLLQEAIYGISVAAIATALVLGLLLLRKRRKS